MKYIIAIIQPTKLEAVKEALSHIELFRLTVSDAQGIGRQKGHTEMYRGAEYEVDFVPKIKVEMVIPDANLQTVLDALIRAAQTGQVGDGKIFVSDLSSVVRIRTGETNESAL